jgi:WD40 repeat protein
MLKSHSHQYSFFYAVLFVLLISLLSGCSKEQTITPVNEIRLTQLPIKKATLSQDATLAAFVHNDNSVSVWDINDTLQRFNWRHDEISEEELSIIAISKNKKWLAVTGYWSTTLIDLHSGTVFGNWQFQGKDSGATASSMQLSSQGDKALVGMTDGTVLELDFTQGRALQFSHNTMKVLHVGYASDNVAFAGGTDKHWFVWDLKQNDIVYKRSYRSRVTASVIDSRSQRAFVSDALNSHEIVDLSDNEIVCELAFMERFRFFRKGLFLENGNYLVTTSPKSVVSLWDANTGEEQASWEITRYSSEATTHALTTNNDGLLVTLSSDGVLQSWDYRALVTNQ